MPAVLIAPNGQPYEFFVSPGSPVYVWVGVPDNLANPVTGATRTLLVYWEPWPRMLEEGPRGQPLSTTFSYTQGFGYDPDLNPASAAGASLKSWKLVTNPGPHKQSFVIFYSVLP
jgi:hypothetical protein